MKLDPGVVQDVAARFNRTRISRYQSFRLGEKEYGGALRSVDGKKVKDISVVEQCSYLQLDSVPFQDARVLDIGCNLGAFSLEALRRGANSVRGIDLDDRCLADAQIIRTLASLLDPMVVLKYNLIKGDFMTEPSLFDGSYNVVLFLAVLHHCKRPLEALKRLYSYAAPGGVLVMEVQMTGIVEDLGEHIVVENLDVTINQRHKKAKFGLGHYPTSAALVEGLSRVGFSEIKVVGTGKLDSRVVIHATK